MQNPMMSLLNNPLKQAMSMANPNTMVQTLLSQNPQVKQLIEQAGGDPKKAFYTLAQQMGVDPEQILSQLR